MREHLCVICQSMLRTQFDVKAHETDETFFVLYCEKCELKQTWPHPVDLTPYYPQSYYGGRHGFTAKYCARRRLKWVRRWVKAPGKLLDVGCGEGTFLLKAKLAHFQVYGIELASRKEQETLIIKQSLKEMEAYGPFDGITLWHVLEHMTSPHAVLGALEKLLAPGGKIFIAVPNAGGWQAKYFGKNWLHLDVPRHLFHFSLPALKHLFKVQEFKILHWWHQEFEYDAMGWAQSALNHLSGVRNIFFNALTGKAVGVKPVRKWLHVLGGVVLMGICLPLQLLSVLMRAGGTMVVVIEKEGTKNHTNGSAIICASLKREPLTF